MAAAGTLASPPDGGPFFRHSRVDHPIIVSQAPRASHDMRLVPSPWPHAVAGERPADPPAGTQLAQGRMILSPGTTVSEPVCAVSWATRGRGSADGSTRSAMVQRVSPGRTV